MIYLTPAAAGEEGAEGGKGGQGGEAVDAPKKPITITSDTMEADRGARLVIFRGNVVAVEDFTLYSDELYIHYNEKEEMREIIAKGNVKIIQEDKTALSEHAVYDRMKRTILLTGNPRVTQCKDTVTGDRITFYMDKDNAFVEGKNGGRVKAVIMPEKDCPGTASSQAGRTETGK